jgi:pimeloyl-ACP methyl ester carboxylesterase
VWASKRYVDIERIRRRAGEAFDRSFYPEGGPRQLSAIYASGDRTEGLRGLAVPTLVIHGRDDTLITPSGGEATAEAIPGANLLLVADMGHDLPQALWPLIVGAILGITSLRSPATQAVVGRSGAAFSRHAGSAGASSLASEKAAG